MLTTHPMCIQVKQVTIVILATHWMAQAAAHVNLVDGGQDHNHHVDVCWQIMCGRDFIRLQWYFDKKPFFNLYHLLKCVVAYIPHCLEWIPPLVIHV